MANHSIRVSALDEKVTVYDLDGNIIKQIPEPPENPPKVKYFNILEYEDKLMGIDPDEKPEFFIDFENDERFRDLFTENKLCKYKKRKVFRTLFYVCTFVIICSSFMLGYILNSN